MIDFGLVSELQYSNEKKLEKNNKVKIKGNDECFQLTKNRRGNLCFMSFEVLKGKLPSKKTEMQSFAYFLIFLFKLNLPWSNVKSKTYENKIQKIIDIHKKVNDDLLCQNLPYEIFFILSDINKLEYSQTPNYEIYIKVLSDLLKILPQKDISISVEDFISTLPKIFNSNDTLYKMISQDLNYDKVLNLIIENVKKNSTNKIYEINKELIIQFSPIKFNFINLPYKIFDFIEENTGKECCVCDRLVRETFLCFICGKKVCSPFNKAYYEREIVKHINICASSY